jgi:regulator of protease activity HflC (stomatin/prohibitin superfamily)
MMGAEREKRAIIARSEGKMQSMINDSEGSMSEMINRSEGEMQRRVNWAEGKANEIEAIAEATATSIEKMSEALISPGGVESMKLRLYTDYLEKIANLAKPNTQIIMPMDLGNFDQMMQGLGLSSIGTRIEDAAQEIEKVVEKKSLKTDVSQQKKPEPDNNPPLGGGFTGLSSGS